MKQLTAYVALAAKREKATMARQLTLNTIAARGSEQAIKKRLKELNK